MKSMNIGLAVVMMMYFLRSKPADELKYSLEQTRAVHLSNLALIHHERDEK